MAAAGSPAAAPDDHPTGFRLRLITISLILAPIVQVFDTSMVSIALVQMRGSLSATQDQIAWVLTSYLVAITITTPLWGALGSIFGRKRLLLVSITGFTLCSLFVGSATSLSEVLFYRFCQGVFGAALIPLALSSLLAIYPRDKFSIAMGYWGVGIMFGPVFGPTVGGYIAEYYSWRWAFYLNVPIGLLAFSMVAILVPKAGNRKRRQFNYFGFIMLAITAGSLQFILDRGNRLDWFESPTIIVLFLIAGAAFWVFIVDSMTSKTPFIDPGIFRDRNYVAGTVLRVLFGAVLFGSLVLLPPFLQNQGGYSILDSGWVLAQRGFGSMVAAFFVGRLIQYVDPRKVMGAAMILIASTIYYFSTLTQDINTVPFTIAVFLQGFAFTSFVIPINTVAFSTLGDDQRDMGTSFYALLNNLGRSLGIAFLATYLVFKSQQTRTILREHITPFNDAFRHFGMPEPWSLTDPAGLAALNRLINQQAELIAYIADFRVLAAIILCCVPVIFFMNNPHNIRTA